MFSNIIGQTLSVIILYLNCLVRINWFTDEVYYAVNEKLFYVTGMFLYLNATVNPIVNQTDLNQDDQTVKPCLDL